MKIHLITLMATNLDADILGHWIDHYNQLELFRKTVFIHEELSSRQCIEQLEDNGFRTSLIAIPPRGYIEDRGSKSRAISRNAESRSHVMEGYSMAVPPNEYILSVDSDEFQQWPDNDIIKIMMHGQIHSMDGQLIDCFDNVLKSAVPNIPLDVQYPKRATQLEYNLYPNMHNTAKLALGKICCHRNDIRIEYGGSHKVMAMPNRLKGCFRSRAGLEVLHYKWRANARERLLTKPWYTENTVDNVICKFLKNETAYV